MERSISIMVGQGFQRHNSRVFVADNVDSNRLDENIHYKCENIEDVYHELFDEALEKYNEKQARKDRIIENYYEKIRTSKQEKLFHEVVVQVGNRNDMGTGDERELAQKVLDRYYNSFEERNPNLRVFSAHLHMDEATPHLHIDFVPYITGSTRGLETRVSLKQALKAEGFKGGNRSDTEWNQWVSSEKNALSEVMKEYGIAWKNLGTHEEHLSVLDYKKQERQKEVEFLETKRDAIRDEIATLENVPVEIEKEIAGAIQKPEEYLPEVKTMESGKSYRERIKPVIEKTMTVLKNLYDRCTFLESDCAYYRRELKIKGKEHEGIKKENDKLFKENKALRSENSSLKKELKQEKAETEKLRGIIREIGPYIVNKAIAAINERLAIPAKKHRNFDHER